MHFDKQLAVIRMRELVTKQVRFLHQGRDENGIDCIGALAYALDYKGLLPAYSRDPVNGELELNLIKHFGECVARHPTIEQLQEGDIVSMQYAGPVRHVAIVGNHPNINGALSLLHTDSMLERVTEHILDKKWLRRIAGVWRV